MKDTLKTALLFVSCFWIAISLPSCGGAGAQTAPGFGPGTGTPTPITPPVSAPPTGGAGDGYDGGAKFIRDVFFAAGGIPGRVNTASFTKTITGKLETAFEWANLSIIDNHSDAGENVALYAQGNKLANGATWGAVTEVIDATTGTGGAITTHEFDMTITGKDTGWRTGLLIVNADAKFGKGLGRSEFAEATTAISIGQSNVSPWASWGTGIELSGNYREAAIRVKGPDGRIVFEVKPNGDIYRRGVLVP